MQFKPAAHTLMILCALSGCAGEKILNSGSVAQNSLLPTSVPYYVDFCGADRTETLTEGGRLSLIPPSRLNAWARGAFPMPANDVGDGGTGLSRSKWRQDCLSKSAIKNGDPLSIQLNRVSLVGTGKYDNHGKCINQCVHDVAVVLSFNASDKRQEPIVAYYERNVKDGDTLNFSNAVVFSQSEWFYTYAPNVRVVLYDVRDDKDAELRTALSTVERGSQEIFKYISGAAAAGPFVEAGFAAARAITSKPHNRRILSMEFQLYPSEQENRASRNANSSGQGNTGPESQQKRMSDLKDKILASDCPSGTLNNKEVQKIQRALNVDTTRGGRGNFGPLTKSAVLNRGIDPSDYKNVRKGLGLCFQKQQTQKQRQGQPDSFGDSFLPNIYNGTYVIFNEQADIEKLETSAQTFDALGCFYYYPDGLRFGGPRIGYSSPVNAANACNPANQVRALRSPFVVFSARSGITTIAADIALRISDLNAKFSAAGGVTQDLVGDLEAAFVDADLAASINRLENTRKPAALKAMIDKLISLAYHERVSIASNATEKRRPSGAFIFRSLRLISDYTRCSLSEQPKLEDLKEIGQAVGLNMQYHQEAPHFQGIVCPDDGKAGSKPKTDNSATDPGPLASGTGPASASASGTETGTASAHAGGTGTGETTPSPPGSTTTPSRRSSNH